MKTMPKTLLVTNDFPPVIGGIESYLRDFVSLLDPNEIIVFAPTRDKTACESYDAQLQYPVIRWPHRLLLPTPRAAKKLREIIRTHDIDTVWFGAAAPLALLAKTAKKAGAKKVISTTHGHEVGWSMIPGARQALRVIGNNSDVLTYISSYTRRRLARPFGSNPRWVHLPSGVNADNFSVASPDRQAAAKQDFGISPDAPTIVCISRFVPRKGQDKLLRAFPVLRKKFPDLQLILVGRGRSYRRLERLRQKYAPDALLLDNTDYQKNRVRVNDAFAAADIFAMPARTRAGGLSVEGLGIVYLEAQACGIPVVAGSSGGAPETITDATGLVVNGHRVSSLVRGLETLLADAQLRSEMGAAGREHVVKNWNWDLMGARLQKELREI